MSKRLQILVDDGEFEEIHGAAARDGLTMSEWVRIALRHARRDRPRRDVAAKLAAVRSAASHAFPTADIEDMLADIARGHEG